MSELADQSVLAIEAAGVRHFSIGSKWLYSEDRRFDATSYAEGALRALDAIKACPVRKTLLGTLCGTIWHPVQNQARSNFKRIYTDSEHGIPFVSYRDMFFLPLRPERFISKRMPKLSDLVVPEGWLVVSRSGTVGNVLYVSRRLATFAITDDAIRIEPRHIEAGYLYAFLSSSFGQVIMAKGAYGATIDHLEPKHISPIPVPLAPQNVRDRVHAAILAAYRLRDEANTLLERAETLLHETLQVSPFTEKDIDYIGGERAPRAFSVSIGDLGNRLDATNHVPLVRSVTHKLERGRFLLVPLQSICSTITIPPRFKRKYVTRERGVPYLLPSQLFTIRPYEMKALSHRQAEQGREYLLTVGHLLLTTDGTVGRVHPVTRRMAGWFGSNNMARLWDGRTDMDFLYAFLATPFGFHQLQKEIYGGVVDHINESHIKAILCPDVPLDWQKPIGDLVRQAFEKKDQANDLEDDAIADVEAIIRRLR